MIGQELKYTAAMLAGRRNWGANSRALRARQAGVFGDLCADVAESVEWVFGRDGALTALAGGEWLGGSSLPRKTAEALLKKMELNAPVVCILDPSHAAQVRYTLGRMQATQALVAVVPDAGDLRMMLGCENFSEEIEAGRLFFASGDWEKQLGEIFEKNPGLPLAGQFVRTHLTDAAVLDDLIGRAQGVFGRQSAARVEQTQAVLRKRVEHRSGVCVVAPMAFRLWDYPGGVLAAVAEEAGWDVLNPDDPRFASPLALARAVCDKQAVVVPNLGRGELPGELSGEIGVLTWVTGGRIPGFVAGCAKDGLLVADGAWVDVALKAGWPAERVKVARYPVERGPRSMVVADTLALIANTGALTTPAFDLSSQRVLWESISRELLENPFAVGLDAVGYLQRWAGRLGIDMQTVQAGVFLNGVIANAYVQGLARVILEAGLPLRIYGTGWDELEMFAGRHAGEVSDYAELMAAAHGARVLVNPSVVTHAHGVEAFGRAVLHRVGLNGSVFGKTQYLNEARKLLAGEGKVGGPTACMDVDLLSSLL